jgi:GNAT superfamily N-acetyltransferase
MVTAMQVKITETAEEIGSCFEVLRELRPDLQNAEELVTRVQQQQREGFLLARLLQDGAVVTVAGFRMQNMLATGLTLYVDDLVTSDAHRSKGHGKTMLDWLVTYAKGRGCDTFSLDSGTHRREAHAFYFREGMRISSFHFSMTLK